MHNKIIENVKTVEIVVILNIGFKDDIFKNTLLACEKYRVNYVSLKDIDKVNEHPSVWGIKAFLI